ncbi:hypothetical protein [Acinetobacter indicus]|uniref:hypothetical protein n=1 Tax=Acinetobacter indicus TaxID=756892 RepID=UPI000948F585|nr:hypothetical protein [Acinetobacter indicus]MCO8088971.1 hypothetical protein [Acinetobacter indicus]
MIKLFGKVLGHYHDIASSISLLPSDDFDKKYSHSVESINKKVLKRTSDQMRIALELYMVSHPEIAEEVYFSDGYNNDKDLKLEMDKYKESVKKYDKRKSCTFAY